MRHSRKLKKIALAIGLLCTGTLAQAQVYELSFVDTLGGDQGQKAHRYLVQPGIAAGGDHHQWAGSDGQA